MPLEDRLATIEDLSDRQKEVLALVARHYARKEIASQLDITESGVKFHIDTIRRRLGVSSSKQAVRMFVEYAAKHDPAFYGQYLKEGVSEAGADEAVSAHERTLQPKQLPLIQLTDLEEAWQRFADPSQASMIGECLEILRTLSQTKPSREAVNTLVMMTGYLTSPGDRTPDDGATTQDG